MEPDLEGILLKEGRKKAWKKRHLRVSPSQRILCYSKETGKQKPKGTLDLSAMIGAQATEEQLVIEKVQYFIFEIELKEDTLRFGATDRLQLDYWLDGLRRILRSSGAVVCKPLFKYPGSFYLGSKIHWRVFGFCQL